MYKIFPAHQKFPLCHCKRCGLFSWENLEYLWGKGSQIWAIVSVQTLEIVYFFEDRATRASHCSPATPIFVQWEMTLNSFTSFHLCGAGVKGLYLHTLFIGCWRWNLIHSRQALS